MDEDNIKKFKEIVDVLDRGTADQAEVAQVFELVFEVLRKMQEDSDAGDGEVRRLIATRVKELNLLIRAVEKQGTTSHAALKKIVDKLVKWRESEAERTTDKDIEEALTLGAQNAADIEAIENKIKLLKLKQGKDGKPGPIPDHEWDGTRIRFEQPDGEWGEWVDLRGPESPGGGFSLFGTGMGGVRRIKAGSNVTVTGDPGEPTINTTPGGGSTMTIEEPSGAVNDSNLDFTFTAKPFLIVMNNQTFRENSGWTWNAGTDTATMFSPAGTGGDIFGLMQT